MCPFWDNLDEIFTQKVSLTPVALYESAPHNIKADAADSNEAELIIDDNVQIDFGIGDNETSFSSLASESQNESQSESQNAFELLTPHGSAQTGIDDPNPQCALEKRLQKKPRANQNNSTALLYEISKMRNEATQKKLELEEKRIEFEKEKMVREFEIRKMEAEARKMEAENIRLQLMGGLPTTNK